MLVSAYGALSFVVPHPWMPCSSVWFSLRPFGDGCEPAPRKRCRWYLFNGDFLVSVLRVQSFVVHHLWLPFSSVWFPYAPSVDGVNNRRVNAADGIGLSCAVLVSVPGV